MHLTVAGDRLRQPEHTFSGFVASTSSSFSPVRENWRHSQYMPKRCAVFGNFHSLISYWENSLLGNGSVS